MQRLEVSCAVRLIYMSLDAKGLSTRMMGHSISDKQHWSTQGDQFKKGEMGGGVAL